MSKKVTTLFVTAFEPQHLQNIFVPPVPTDSQDFIRLFNTLKNDITQLQKDNADAAREIRTLKEDLDKQGTKVVKQEGELKTLKDDNEVLKRKTHVLEEEARGYYELTDDLTGWVTT
ncbi:hypothetical protein DXG03_006552, partial [Asterophora parasitica]